MILYVLFILGLALFVFALVANSMLPVFGIHPMCLVVGLIGIMLMVMTVGGHYFVKHMKKQQEEARYVYDPENG